jgi:hypothetical protein
MTSYDAVLDRVGARIDRLPRRCVAALFLACSMGLRPELEAWMTRQGIGRSDVFDRAARAVRDYAVGAVPVAATLLDAVWAEVPPGEETTTAEEDCWICLDVAVRVAVDEAFVPGPCIEYALEPKSEVISERLFGVTQVGSGPGEEEAMRTLLADTEFRVAVGFVEWAVGMLEQIEIPSTGDVEVLVARADAIQP